MGFEIGDALLSINGNRPRDLIDYQFLCADEFLATAKEDEVRAEKNLRAWLVSQLANQTQALLQAN